MTRGRAGARGGLPGPVCPPSGAGATGATDAAGPHRQRLPAPPIPCRASHVGGDLGGDGDRRPGGQQGQRGQSGHDPRVPTPATTMSTSPRRSPRSGSEVCGRRGPGRAPAAAPRGVPAARCLLPATLCTLSPSVGPPPLSHSWPGVGRPRALGRCPRGRLASAALRCQPSPGSRDTGERLGKVATPGSTPRSWPGCRRRARGRRGAGNAGQKVARALRRALRIVPVLFASLGSAGHDARLGLPASR